ncbi:hypothetical protein ABXJ76_04565 [Methylobacter sp. G7]|uniref:hypothetical protein n=1 Tax=Methylobacter sp. G7 TaxID=3230117 RepID=UPI003D8008CE
MPTVIKFSTCLPGDIYRKLAEAIRTPYSAAPEGTFDKGAMANWVQRSAIATIEGKAKQDAMRQFVIAKGLLSEFEQFNEQLQQDALAQLLGYSSTENE